MDHSFAGWPPTWALSRSVSAAEPREHTALRATDDRRLRAGLLSCSHPPQSFVPSAPITDMIRWTFHVGLIVFATLGASIRSDAQAPHGSPRPIREVLATEGTTAFVPSV